MTNILTTHAETIRRAFAGAGECKELLTKIAQDCFDKDQYHEAALLFIEVMRSYRVGELRASALFEDALQLQRALSSEVQLLEQWIQSHPQGLCAIPRTVVGLSRLGPLEWVQVWQSDEKCVCAIRLLERNLTELGEHFFSPGGTVERRAATLLQQYFGFEPIDDAHVLTIHRVRIALDTLAEKIIERNVP